MQERIVGECFIVYYNKLNDTKFILESLEQRKQRNDPPDLIFYNNSNVLKLEVEITGGYDAADINSKKRQSGGNEKPIKFLSRINPVFTIIDRISAKINLGCENLLIDCYCRGPKDKSDARWHWGMELSANSIRAIKNKLQDGEYGYFKKIWIIFDDKPIIVELK